MEKKHKIVLSGIMDVIGIKDIDIFIDHLIDYTRPIAERECGTLLDNIFIVRADYSPYRRAIRIYWSADNYPGCNKIYAHNYSYDISDVLVNYRDWKLNKVLCDE